MRYGIRGIYFGGALTLLIILGPLFAMADDRLSDSSHTEAENVVEFSDDAPANSPSSTTPAVEPVGNASEMSDASSQGQDDDENEPGTLVGWMELSGRLREGPPPFVWTTEQDLGTSLRRVIRQLHTVAQRPDYLGVVIYLQNPLMSLSQVDEVTHAIKAVREAGKKVLIFADHYDMRTYLLACSADEILLQRKGMIELPGLGVEEMYLAGLFQKVGLKADMIQVGKFKGADEALTRTDPSEAWNQNIDSLLDNLYEQILDRIGTGRGLTHEQVEALFADCWAMTDEQYVERGVVDELTDRDLIEVTSDQFGDYFEWDDLLDWSSGRSYPSNPFSLFQMLFQDPSTKLRKRSLALIHASGPIRSGEGQTDGPFGGDAIGSLSMSRALAEVRDNELIEGAVIRIDSPGGSALASEVIWQAVREVSQDKPVFISIGSMAASGGYYIACAGDEIYVSPSTIVGSIGVVGGKIILGELYDKIGVTIHRRSRGPLGDMFNSVEPFTAEQRQALRSAFDRIYEQFTQRVQIGRGKRVGDMQAVAQGRLFSGHQAVQSGLADQVGGIEVVIADLAKQLGLEDGQYEVVNLPRPQSLSDVLEDLFGASSNPKMDVQFNTWTQTAREVLGPRLWESAKPVWSGMLLLRHEPALLLMPAAISIR